MKVDDRGGEKPSTTDLFGEDSSDDEEPQFDGDDVQGVAGAKAAPPPKPVAEKRPEGGEDDDDDPMEEEKIEEDDTPKEAPPLTLADIPVPGPNVHLHITKLPNLISIQSQAFDEDDPITSGAAVCRWRYQTDSSGNRLRDADGRLLRESNTRIIEWEDGSRTLHIGTEAFALDVIQPPGVELLQYSHATATVLESAAQIQDRWTIRPASLKSEAHQNLTVQVRQKTIQKARIAEIATTEDPEKAKQDRIQLQSDLNKAQQKKKASSSGGYRQPRMSRGYLEEDDGHYDTFDIRNAKRGGYDDMDDYGDDDEDESSEEDEIFNRRPAKKARDESDEEIAVQKPGDDDDEDDDDDVAPTAPKPKTQSRTVFDDDSDSD